MAALTKAAANAKKALANSEPSTHGTSRPFGPVPKKFAIGVKRTKADFAGPGNDVNDPEMI